MIEVRIFVDNENLYGNEKVDEYIMRYLLHHQINGATLFRGEMGFGRHHHLHTPRKLGGSDALPVMIVFVDEEENVRKVIPHLKEVVAGGLIITHSVERA